MGLGWLGEVSTPRGGCLIFRRPRPTRRFFVENRMAKNDQKTESLGKANTKGYKVVSARRKSVRLITRR